MTKTVLITGADGGIGSHLRKALAHQYTLRLLSHKPIEGVESAVADIADMQKLVPLFQGVDSIVHLAASAAVNSSWDEVLHNNIIGTYSVFEAARQAGVKQIIFASSNHAVGAYEKEFEPGPNRSNKIIDHLVPVRPDSLYGVSKCFGEALGRYYADQHNMRVICLRIGSIRPGDRPGGNADPASPGVTMWQSERDFAQMVDRCLMAEDIRFDIFYGVSNNPYNFFDLDHARDVIGYEPQDSSLQKLES
jgi:NAD+ dependent glucose-6-phosphate dehydrogenase